MSREKIKECLDRIQENNLIVFESLSRTDFEAFLLLHKHLELVYEWGILLEGVLEQGNVELDIFARSKILANHCTSLKDSAVSEKLALVVSISSECELLCVALESFSLEKVTQETPIIGLTMAQMAYGSLVWSLQEELSPEDFVVALVEQKSAVLEKYGDLTKIANLKDQEIYRLQEELKLLYPSQVVDMQLAFGHLFVVLFGSENVSKIVNV